MAENSGKIYYREALACEVKSEDIAYSYIEGRIGSNELFELDGKKVSVDDILRNDDVVREIVRLQGDGGQKRTSAPRKFDKLSERHELFKKVVARRDDRICSFMMELEASRDEINELKNELRLRQAVSSSQSRLDELNSEIARQQNIRSEEHERMEAEKAVSQKELAQLEEQCRTARLRVDEANGELGRINASLIALDSKQKKALMKVFSGGCSCKRCHTASELDENMLRSFVMWGNDRFSADDILAFFDLSGASDFSAGILVTCNALYMMSGKKVTEYMFHAGSHVEVVERERRGCIAMGVSYILFAMSFFLLFMSLNLLSEESEELEQIIRMLGSCVCFIPRAPTQEGA